MKILNVAHAEPRREFPRREKQQIAEEVDANGDVVFRFKVAPPTGDPTTTLEAFYRSSLLDLLRIVRLFYRGEPVIVDAFAFLNAPHTPIPLIPERADTSAAGSATEARAIRE